MYRQLSPAADNPSRGPLPAMCRFCCKSLFAQVIKNFPGCRRDFRVKMWGTSSPDDKLTGGLPNEIEATHIGGFRSDRVIAGKLAPGSFGLLQQYLPRRDLSRCSKRTCANAVYSITSLTRAISVCGISRPSALAVVRFMMKSNFVGCSTGMSPGLAPRRILST
jgi:hypothetical protein